MLAITWSIEHFVVYISLLFMGITTEILSVQAGVWSYPTDRAFHFPIWIPLIWSNGALFIIEFKEWIDTTLEKVRKRRA